MRRLVGSSLAWALLFAGVTQIALAQSRLAETGQVASETLRTHRVDKRVVNMWWLPVEYWVAAGSELGKKPSELEEIRQVFRGYTLIAALDVEVRPDGSFDALSIAEIVRRSEFQVNGEDMEVLRQVSGRLQELATELAYVLRASLGPLGAGLRVLPLRNLGDDDELLASGEQRCAIRARYLAAAGHDPVEFYWRGPLTAVAGSRRCPEGGEPLQASWLHCPWHGVEVPASE